MCEVLIYVYSNKNCIVYFYILIFIINIVSFKLLCDVGYLKVDLFDGDVWIVMYIN